MPPSASLARLRAVTSHNTRTLLAAPLAELSGSLGDLGTLLPLLTALALQRSIALAPTLLFTGLANVLTGAFFGIPLPVQPMKAIAAVALARGFTREVNAAAGIVTGGVVGVLSVAGVLRWAEKVAPVPVVKGIQVGAGLSLCLSAGTSLLAPLSWAGPWWGDNLVVAALAGLALLATLVYPRVPYALVIFVVGLMLAALSPAAASTHPVVPGANATFPILHPAPKDFLHATLTAALGQLPLTLLNSVIAVSALSADLLASPPYPPAPPVTSLGISVAALNLVSCWFGSMPACHGSGGLAGQYRFGARSGSSVIVLGVAKMGSGVVALWFSDGILSVLGRVPKALLGVLVLAAGIELAKVGESINSDARDLRILGTDREGDGERGEWDGKRVREPSLCEKKDRWMVMLVTVATLLAFKNDAVGFVAGMCWHWGSKVAGRVEERRAERGEGRVWRGEGRERERESQALLGEAARIP